MELVTEHKVILESRNIKWRFHCTYWIYQENIHDSFKFS